MHFMQKASVQKNNVISCANLYKTIKENYNDIDNSLGVGNYYYFICRLLEIINILDKLHSVSNFNSTPLTIYLVDKNEIIKSNTKFKLAILKLYAHVISYMYALNVIRLKFDGLHLINPYENWEK